MEDKGFDILNYPLSVLRRIGFYSEINGKRVVIFASVCILMFIFLEIVVLMQFSYIRGDLFEFVSNMEALGGYAQAIGKTALMAYHQEKFKKLVEATRKFRKAKECRNAVKIEINSIFDRVLSLEKLFTRSSFSAVFLWYITLFFGRALIIGIWKMENYTFLYKIVLVLQIVTILIIIVFIPAFDCLFLAFCTNVVVQFRILSYSFQELNVERLSFTMDVEDCYKKMKKYIKQHVFLLEFIKHLQDVYSLAILCECMTIAPIICTDMYALSEGNNIQIFVRHGTALFAQIIQLAFYCIPANFVAEEVLSISKAVFQSDWHSEYYPQLRKPLVFIIQTAQKHKTFTAGGLIEINARTLLSVLRVSWSACTLFRALK